MRDVESCHSISAMTNLSVCSPASQFSCLGLPSLLIHQHPSPPCCASLQLPLCGSFHRWLQQHTSFFSYMRLFAAVFHCVCAGLQKQSGSVTASVLGLFNLDQRRNHRSVHQVSHLPGPASKRLSNTFVSLRVHGIIAHLSHLSVCPLIHLSTDPSKSSKRPDI